MIVLWPWALALLGLIPALVGLYIWMLRRRRRYAVRYSSLGLVREALAPGSQWRRHLPFALFLAGLAGLALAVTRPVAIMQVPTNQTAILLAIDISRSMCSDDIPPDRLAAAQEAALEFIARQPDGTRFGIVAFAGFAQLIQQPTDDRAALEAAVKSLTTARGTAIGSGIVTALDAIAALNPAVPRPSVGTADAEAPPPLPEGQYQPEIIVLLTDGVTTTGPTPQDAAQLAAERGVRIYPIGFGTAEGGTMACLGQFQPNDRFGGGGGPQFEGGGGPQFGGRRFRRGIDEATLIQVADMTGGEYYAASSAGELQQVFENLPITFTSQEEESEISFIFAGLGALLALTALALSLRWNPIL